MSKPWIWPVGSVYIAPAKDWPLLLSASHSQAVYFMSSSSPSMQWRHLKKMFGLQPCVNLDASTWFHAGPLQSHVESAVTNTSALPFDWWEVCEARPRPFAVSQAVCHITRRVLLWSSPVHWPTLHCRSGQRRENTRRLPVRSDSGFFYYFCLKHSKTCSGRGANS